MKILRLKIKNIGMIADEDVEINKPLILFYGDCCQGKSTILNAIRWVCGAAFPSDIIRHGEKEASIMLEFDGGMVAKSWYINAKKETVGRAITFIRDGKPVESPISELKRLMNPFMLDQDFLVKKTELERKRYFTDLFAVDTTDLDKSIWTKGNDATKLRAKISGYGDIDVTPVLKVDTNSLEVEINRIKASNKAAEDRAREEQRIASEHNSTVQRGIETMSELGRQIKELTEKLEKTKAWLEKNPRRSEAVTSIGVDTDELETKLREAGAQNVRHENYLANVKRNEQKQQDEQKLKALELEQRNLKEEKIKRLKSLNENCKIVGLTFDDDGNFVYKGTQAGMLSTSQLMTLSSELSALYPEGLGIELLDRGESLGKSIFGFVDRAQRDKVTILATIVGEKPATVPENIGVFVVEGGKVK